MHIQLLGSPNYIAAGLHTHVHHIKRLQRSLYLFFCLRATEKKKGPGYFRSPSLKERSGFTKTDFRSSSLKRKERFTETVTPQLRSLGPNVQQRMVYFAM